MRISCCPSLSRCNSTANRYKIRTPATGNYHDEENLNGEEEGRQEGGKESSETRKEGGKEGASQKGRKESTRQKSSEESTRQESCQKSRKKESSQEEAGPACADRFGNGTTPHVPGELEFLRPAV